MLKVNKMRLNSQFLVILVDLHVKTLSVNRMASEVKNLLF